MVRVVAGREHHRHVLQIELNIITVDAVEDLQRAVPHGAEALLARELALGVAGGERLVRFVDEVGGRGRYDDAVRQAHGGCSGCPWAQTHWLPLGAPLAYPPCTDALADAFFIAPSRRVASSPRVHGVRAALVTLDKTSMSIH